MKEGLALNIILLVVLIVLVLSLPGCTGGWTTVKTAVAINSARVADEAFIAARWLNCDEVSAGALRRRYANDPVGMKTWQDYCSGHGEQAVVPK